MSEKTDYHLHIPHESPTPTLLDLLQRAFPDREESDLRAALAGNRVSLDGDPVRRPGLVLRPGGYLRASLSPLDGEDAYDDAYPDAHEYTRGDTWVLVDKPVGMPGGPPDDDPTHPFRYLADQLGLDRDSMTPVWPMPRRMGGPWLLAHTPADARKLAEGFATDTLQTTWTLLVPLVDPAQGNWTSPSDQRLNYATIQRHEGLAEIQVTPTFNLQSPTGFDPIGTILQTASAHGSPALGDRRRGGYVVPGPIRCRLSSVFGERDDLQISIPVAEKVNWWPGDRVAAREAPDQPEAPSTDEIPIIDVTSEVLSAVESGRPWVDQATGTRAMDHGEFARLRGRDGREPGLFAFVDHDGPPAARLWSADPWEVEHLEEAVALAVDNAVATRYERFTDIADCDLFRMVHGEADGLPGIFVDRLGPLVRVTTTTRAAHDIRDLVIAKLVNYDPECMILATDRIPRRAISSDLVHSAGRYLDVSGVHFAREYDRRIPIEPSRLESPGRLIALRSGREVLQHTLSSNSAPTRWVHLAPAADGCLAALGQHKETKVAATAFDERSRELASRAWTASGADTARLELLESSPTDLLDWVDSFGPDALVLDVDMLSEHQAEVSDLLESGISRALVYRSPTIATTFDDEAPAAPDIADVLSDVPEDNWERLELPSDVPALSTLPEIAPASMAWYEPA